MYFFHKYTQQFTFITTMIYLLEFFVVFSFRWMNNVKEMGLKEVLAHLGFVCSVSVQNNLELVV